MICKAYNKSHRNDPGNEWSPVETAPIPVLATGLIQFLDIYIALTDNEIICNEDAKNWTKEDTVTTQESQESGGIGKDVPWANGNAEQVSDPHTSTNIEESREQGHEIGTKWNDVCSHVSNAVCKDEKCAYEEDGCSATCIPVVSENIVLHSPWVPVQVTPNIVDGRCSVDTKGRTNCVGNRKCNQLGPNGGRWLFGVSSNIWLVDDKGRSLSHYAVNPTNL
jgi:hypothetical protein